MNELNNITVTDIKQMFTVMSPRGKTAEITDREYFGLSFCLDGQITYAINGEKIISDETKAVFLPKGKNYSLHGDKTGRFPVINFDCDNFSCDKILSFTIPGPAAYVKDYEKMKALFLFEGNRAEIMSIFYGILHRISLDNTLQNRLAPAINLIQKDFGNSKLSNEDLAHECKISEVYFRKLFTETYKLSPKQYLLETRINNAKQLLADGFLKINAVATCCGFTNQYHFCRIFKEKTGFTPTEYSKHNKVFKI
mgnify:CR=1 FL=1